MDYSKIDNMAKPINSRKFNTEETKKKISESIKQKWLDPEYRNRSFPPKGVIPKGLIPFISRDQRGDKNPNWKGGITSVVTLIRKSRKYKSWVKSIFIRDSYTCKHCNQKGGTLNAHHIKSFSSIIKEIGKVDKELYNEAFNFEPLWDVNNGITLCVPCHIKTESYSVG